jgi:excinuclease ABC subunit A
MKDNIIKGARQHNLKNISITIPRDELVVIMGVSGSGKSTLAFDTLYAEGQRRYIESHSHCTRYFSKKNLDSWTNIFLILRYEINGLLVE